MTRRYPSVEAMVQDDPRLLRFWLADLEATVDEVMAAGQPQVPKWYGTFPEIPGYTFRYSKEEWARIEAAQDWYPRWAAEVHATL